MSKGSEELTRARKEEIISACEQLYKTMNFKDITIKEIANAASFTRTFVYHYFKTKEEIFLALLQREYELWNDQLRRMRKENETMSPPGFAAAMAHSLEERKTLLKLMSMNHYDMEENSSIEKAGGFQAGLRTVPRRSGKMPDAVFTGDVGRRAKGFVFSFFPFMFGIYPYTVVSDKQRKAMELAEVNYVYMSIYEITFAEIKKLLNI